MMLATWLVEIYLSKINQLEDIAAAESASDDVENYRTERTIVEDDLKQFLQQYKVSVVEFSNVGAVENDNSDSGQFGSCNRVRPYLKPWTNGSATSLCIRDW